MKTTLALLLSLVLFKAASAGDVLWYLGHSGYDEGHQYVTGILNGAGAVVDVSSITPLPDLGGYRLIFIFMPGFTNPIDFFTEDEKVRLTSWLGGGGHRVVLVGDWDGFYQGGDVLEDLLQGLGRSLEFAPGGFDQSCGHCNGALGSPDPLTLGLHHVCYSSTATWTPGLGVPLAYPEDPSAPGPYLVSAGAGSPCIVGIGDSNILSDICPDYLGPGGDPDTQEFVRRLYTATCGAEEVSACCLPNGRCQLLSRQDCDSRGGIYHAGQSCDQVDCTAVPVEETTWGRIKSVYGDATK